MKKLLLSIALVWSSLHAFAQSGIEIPAKLSDRPEIIIHHTGYTLSYNTTHGTPNWSAWVLTKTHVLQGHIERTNDFQPDPAVPTKYRVSPSDYTNSGYDRGHLYPAADASWSSASMHHSFYMSNMTPQVPTLNRIYWKQLEDACRRWTIPEDTLYIVSGPIYKQTSIKTIGHSHKVDIPSGFFKVILSLRKGHAKAIGFYYLNTSAKQSMTATVSTVDFIESLTGIDFFYQLEDNLENRLESHCNLNDWH